MDREDLLHSVKTKASAVWALYVKWANLMDEFALAQLDRDLDELTDTLHGDIKELEKENE